jgi:hypothetical protein
MLRDTTLTHAFRNVGFDYYTSKLGEYELILHEYEHMQIPADNKDRGKNAYGEARKSYR